MIIHDRLSKIQHMLRVSPQDKCFLVLRVKIEVSKMLPVLVVPSTFRSPSTESIVVLAPKILRGLRRPKY